MEKRTIAGLAILCQAAGVLAATGVVKLSGTVTRTGGGALKDVSVSLKSSANLSAKTGTDGKFLISSGASALQRATESVAWAPRVEIQGTNLRVAIDPTSQGATMEVVSGDGRRILTEHFGDGGYPSKSIPATSLASGLNLLRWRNGARTMIQPIVRVDRNLYPMGIQPSSTVSDNTSLERAAAAAVDTLVASKAGYQDKLLPISSYLDSNLVIAMDSLTTCPAPKAGTSKSNPIFTDLYSADPGVMVDNCTFYIQAGHDEGSGGFVMNEWFLYKSTDMVTWTRTTAMNLKIFSWTNANAWAGQMIKARNGKYYWYVPINDIKFSKDRMAIGVAVADKPEGPWKDALGKPIVNDSVEMATFGGTNIDQTPHTIDPTVFIDDDGQAYLQYGGFWTMVSVKLNPDMISLGSKLVKSTPLDYFESPYLIKRNGLYYQIYARGSANPTTIDYATSTNPQGPWTWRGQILGKMPKVAGQDEPTNHAAVAEFAGQWYIVYHVSNGPNGGGTYKRMVAIDKMFFNADGTIKPVTPSPALTF